MSGIVRHGAEASPYRAGWRRSLRPVCAVHTHVSREKVGACSSEQDDLAMGGIVRHGVTEPGGGLVCGDFFVQLDPSHTHVSLR